MTRPSATCELFLDGARVPDTAAALLEGTPTALDALALTWGRDGANEQPGPATCSFRILDQTPNPDFLDEIHVGSTVAVWAEGRIPTDAAGSPTFDNPGFIGRPDGPVPSSDLVVTGATAAYQSEQVVAQGRGTPLALYVPPRKFSPAGTLPDAWESIPTATVGDTWTIIARAKVPAGVGYRLTPSFFFQPYYNSGVTAVLTPEPSNRTGTGDWETLSVTFRITALPPDYQHVWVGVTLYTYTRVGNRWQDMAPTLAWGGAIGTWEDQASGSQVWLDNTDALAPPTTTRRVLVFSGSVTDMEYQPLGDGVLEARFTSADLGADLGNRVIGDTPWPVQTVANRANRIAQLAGITTSPRVRIDAPLGTLQVSSRDVDAQPSYQLLQDLAQTAGGVLWAATHLVTGPFLWIENPANRTPLAELTLTSGVIVITGASDSNTLLSACDLLEEPVRWRQDTQDVATVAAVTWLEQGPLDESGYPTTTERTETITDAAGVAQYGTRRLSVSTELVSATDATSLANRLLASARAVGWRISGLTLDTDAGPEDVASIGDDQREIALLNMLDGTARMGLGVVLVDMPSYAPRGSISNVYLEGGTYSFEGGAWTLDLGAAPGSGQGSSAKWGQLDAAWRWNQWAPSITYQSLFGVAP